MSTTHHMFTAGLSYDGCPAYATIHGAMLAKRQIRAYRQGHALCLCPHALGWREGAAYVLGFMIQPDPTLPGAPGSWLRWLRLWQWLQVSDLDGVHVVDGPWFTQSRWCRPAVRLLAPLDGQGE